MDRSIFYITAENMAEAEKIAELLVRTKLAACVNIIPCLKSFFYWEGKLQAEEEVLLIGKTKSVLIDEVVETVKKHHSYEVPCIISWKIEGGNQEFLEWIDKETKNH